MLYGDDYEKKVSFINISVLASYAQVSVRKAYCFAVYVRDADLNEGKGFRSSCLSHC